MRSAALLVVTLATSLSASAQDKKPSLAVLPMRISELQANESKRIAFQVRQTAETKGGYVVQDEEKTTKLLEASQDLGLDCDINALDCGSQIGKLADVDVVLMMRATGRLGATETSPGSVGIDLRLVDVRKATELRHLSGVLPPEPSLQVTALGEIVDLLYGTGALVALDVSAEPAGARVYVDGVLRGTAPLPAPVDALAPGAHHVRIALDGYLPFDGPVVIQRGEAARLEVRLEFNPAAVKTEQSPVAIAVPFVVGGVGVALAIAGGVLTPIGADPWFRYEAATQTIAGAKPGDRGYVATVTEQWRQADKAAGDWESYGQALTVSGIGMLALGSVAAIAGVGVGVYMLLAPPEEGPQAVE